MEIFRSAAKTTSDLHLNSLLLGGVVFRMGRFHEAVRHLEHASRVENRSRRGWAFLAMSYARLGKIGEARRWYQRLEQWAPLPWPRHKVSPWR